MSATAPARTPLRSRPDTLPSRAAAAVQVLQLVDDPDATTSDLAGAIGADPALAARIMALANSSYFGLSGRVSNLTYAVSVIGFQAIRALAVSVAADLDGPAGVPDGFWRQSATAATAAALIAPRFAAQPGDAFTVGLLHTLGSALLHQQSPLPELCLPAVSEPDELIAVELERYGVNHATAGAQVLRGWRFPERLCAVIEGHHDAPLPDASPLEKTLHAARMLTDLALTPDAVPDGANTDPVEPNRSAPAAALSAEQAAHLFQRHHLALRRLSEGSLTDSQIPPLLDQIGRQAEALHQGLTSRS